MASNKENSQRTPKQDAERSVVRSKVPSRKLHAKRKIDSLGESYKKYRDSNDWDNIESPQFADLASSSGKGDSFFNKSTPIVRTPIPNISVTTPDEIDTTLIASFNKISLSPVNRESPKTVCRNNNDRKENMWDTIKPSQFVDFQNSLDGKLTFYDKSIPTTSTPIPDAIMAADLNETDNTVKSVLFPINRESITASENNKENVIKEQHECLETPMGSEPEPQIWDKIKKSQTAVIYPFTFDLRNKRKREVKLPKKEPVPETERDIRVFRANPVPRYLKSRIANKENSNNNNKQAIDNPTEKTEKSNKTDPKTKKTTEPWKKPPFVPCRAKKNTECSKAPVLHTRLRAQERKRFDEAVQEKERQKEQVKQIEKFTKKKQEENAIVQLRKKIAFKAQPIPRYKMVLPNVKKRALTEPISPLTLKRRRKLSGM